MIGRPIVQGAIFTKQLLKKFINKHFFPRRYIFNSIVPQNRLAYFYVPRKQWVIQKQQKPNTMRQILFCCVFVIGFGLGDFLYSLYYNTKQQYRLRLLYPELTYNIDQVLNNQYLKPWISILKDVWVKDYVEFQVFWNRVYQEAWIKPKEKWNQSRDERILEKRKEMEELKKVYPQEINKSKQSVF